jgi:hypothetical protein
VACRLNRDVAEFLHRLPTTTSRFPHVMHPGEAHPGLTALPRALQTVPLTTTRQAAPCHPYFGEAPGELLPPRRVGGPQLGRADTSVFTDVKETSVLGEGP